MRADPMIRRRTPDWQSSSWEESDHQEDRCVCDTSREQSRVAWRTRAKLNSSWDESARKALAHGGHRPGGGAAREDTPLGETPPGESPVHKERPPNEPSGQPTRPGKSRCESQSA